MYEYPESDRNVPSGVKKEIENFRKMPSKGDKEKIPLLYWLLGKKGTPFFKMSKKDAKYGASSDKYQNCSNCRYIYLSMREGHFICSKIKGSIEPELWCKLWRFGNMKVTKNFSDLISKFKKAYRSTNQ